MQARRAWRDSEQALRAVWENFRLKLGSENIRKLVGGVGFQAEYAAEILCKLFVHAAFQPFYYHAE